MIRIHAKYLAQVRSATTAAELYDLLQGAIQLEHATIPPYLTAAYSLKGATNAVIRDLIRNIAKEEMLHMAIVANVLNAIGGRPQIDTPDFIPHYPGTLPMSIESGLVVGLRKFSKELVHDVFMPIEAPPEPLDFPVEAFAKVSAPTFATIGQFYAAIMAKIQELGDGIFTGDPTRQVIVDAGFPSEQLFAITSVDTAVKALTRVVREGEGTTTLPLDDEGEPAHYYRFKEIYLGKFLVPDPEHGFVFKGDIPFAAADVFDLPDNPKMADYAEGSQARKDVETFNKVYSDMLRSLQRAFDGGPDEIRTAVSAMTFLKRNARALVAMTDPATGKALGLTFEYVPA